MAIAPVGTAILLTDLGLGSPKLDPTNTNLVQYGLNQQQAKALNKAYTTLPGVLGNTPTIQLGAGNAVYQPLDGYTVGTTTQGDGRPSVALGAYPSGYLDSNGTIVDPAYLSPSTFNSWSSQFQKQYLYQIWTTGYPTNNFGTGTLDYILRNGANFVIGNRLTTAANVVLTPAIDSSGNPLTTPARVIVMENLTKTSFAKMDLATQTLVAQNPAFFVLAKGLNLSTDTSSIISKLQTMVAKMKDAANLAGVDLSLTYDNSGFPTGSTFTGSTYPSNGNRFQDGRLLNYDDVSVFIKSAAMLADQLKNMRVYSPNDIDTKLNALYERFTHVVAFGNVPNQVSAADLKGSLQDSTGTGIHDGNGNFNNTVVQTMNVVSIDTNPSVNSYNSMVYYHVTGNNSASNAATIDQRAGASNAVVQVDPNNPDGMFTAYDGQVRAPGPDFPKLNLNANQIKTDISNLQNSGQPGVYQFDGTTIKGDYYGIIAKGVNSVQTYNVAAGQTNQSTIQTGYNKIMQAEEQTLALQQQMTIVATSGVLKDKSLDVPSLIFFLQLYTNLVDEQQTTAATELVNQQNALLNAYSQMQGLVNAVQGKFASDKPTQQLDIFGNDYDSVSNNLNLTSIYVSDLLNGGTQKNNKPIQTAPNGQASLNLLSMFDKRDGAYAKNPIEQIFKIDRPKMAFIDDSQGATQHTIAYTATAFNSFGTSLSSAVTQINQQTQIMMNNINTLDKEKNQHFDLANNCLSKLNDILAAIGRNVM